MKLATFAADGAAWTGAVLGDAIVALQPALDAACSASDQPAEWLPVDLRGLLAAGEAALVSAARAVAFAARPENAALRRPLAGVTLLAPLAPGKILGVGRNYADHARKSAGRR
ncbi:hypothetical protein ACFQY5_26265 [Paeniroseomonas aquatica]|uniref:hypothetical protein n=1 Tax=Paeniroseomonas aquatica TaxID=373043 RepID=UPI003624260D